MRSREEIDALARGGILMTRSAGEYYVSERAMGAILFAVAQWLSDGECERPTDVPQKVIDRVVADITAIVADAKAAESVKGD